MKITQTEEEPTQSDYKLFPAEDGGYVLYSYNKHTKNSRYRCTVDSVEEAKKVIANLRRPVVFLNVEDEQA